AETIVRAAERPRREVFVGGAARAMNVLHAVLPALYEQAARSMTDYDHFQDRTAGPTPRAVLAPVASGTDVTGGWTAGRAEARRRHGNRDRAAGVSRAAGPAAGCGVRLSRRGSRGPS